MTAPDVIAHFQQLTGKRIRVVTHDMEAQAIAYVKHGFTLDDLADVIRWTQEQIGRRNSSFSELSLQWHVVFGRHGAGDEWGTFQERLDMAQKRVRTRPAPKAMPVTTDTGDGKVTRLELVEPADKATPEMRERIAASLSELTKRLSA